LGQKLSGLVLVRSFGTASATPPCLRRWIVHLLLDHTVWPLFTFVGASRGHLCDYTAFLLILTSGRSGAQFAMKYHSSVAV